MEWSVFAGILLVASCVAVAAVAAVARTWSLHSRLYSLEDRMAVVEGVTQREVKIRAAQARINKPNKDEELASALLAPQAQAPAKKMNWWETNLPRSVPH